GYLDAVPVARVKDWQSAFIRAFNTQYVEIANAINTQKALPDDLRDALANALKSFNENWS
ncbi:MAG TPA: hypothetical protein PLZ51_08420, partial [Aggregatilineales bacterium]|nr:hypothetical protein [Aggregatilineales bacterium]